MKKMNLSKKLFYPIASIAAVSSMSFLSSCVNSIADDELKSGSIPILLSTPIQSRAANNMFEVQDTIGLYLLSENETLSTNRYLDNEPFYFADSKPASREQLYYPYDAEKCSFVSYYPFKSYAIQAGSSVMSVSVCDNQKADADYNYSDFMLAVSKDVVPSKNPVTLHHTHKFSLVDFILQPTAGSTAESLLSANPKITLLDMFTRGYYDFEAGSLSSLEIVRNMTPHGTWVEKDGCLVGQSVIVVPQKIAANTSFVKLNIGGRDIVYELGADFTFGSTKRSVLTIPCSNTSIGEMTASISDWGKGPDSDMQMINLEGGISFASLPFDQSKVCNVFDKSGMLIAKVCKEYLSGTDIDTQAIVAYQAIQGTVDDTKGVVLKILGRPDVTVGGTVEWSKTDNTLKYTPGKINATNRFYVDSKNKLVLAKPEEFQVVKIMPEMMVDKRSDEIQSYPIVKIGTQYWIAEDIATTLYVDGTKIEKRDILDITEKTACFLSNNGSIFYNFVALNTGKLVPRGWKVPSEVEWGMLQSYIKDDTSKLGASDWVYKGVLSNDITGFHASGKGCIANITSDDTEGRFMNGGSGITYWYTDSNSKAAGRCRVLKVSTKLQKKEFSTGEYEAQNNMKASSLRLIRD